MNRPLTLTRGRYTARMAGSGADLQAAQHLRFRCFRSAHPDQQGRDCDSFDSRCRHVLVEDRATGQLLCCYRLLHLAGGQQVSQSYSAQFYDLSALAALDGPMIEMGRFCVHPDWHDPDILRLAWGVMTAIVDRDGVRMLFGCSSFAGTRPERYADAFALLRDRYLAPDNWRPQVRAARICSFAQGLTRTPDLKRAQVTMPPLLRTYLLMGGRVSDHAVVDPDLDTLHVFTGLEIQNVPPARAQLLRAVAGYRA